MLLSNSLALGLFTIHTLLKTRLRVNARSPLAVATGMLTKQSYFEKYQPGYSYAKQAISKTSWNAKVYSLFEPRSYGISRSMQPDPILDDFSHDLYLYGDPESIVRVWKRQG